MKKKSQKNFLLVLIVLSLLFYKMYISYSVSISEENNDVNSNLKIYFLDVGQGDSILITNNDYNMLIDAGNNEDGPKLVEYFKKIGIKKFDYLVGTHPHEDHIGGLDDVVDNFEVTNIYLPDVYTTTKTFEDLLDSIDKKDLSITVPEIGEKIKLGEVVLEFIYTGSDLKDLNNSSIVIRSDFGNVSCLFTGDATNKVENLILDKNIDVDVLKVGHHGSAYSSSDSFLSKVSPKYAIISLGKGNSYGHPSDGTLGRISNYTNKIYRTDELGTIVLNSDGNQIDFEYLKTDTNG